MKIYLLIILSIIFSMSLLAAPEQQTHKKGKIIAHANLYDEPKYQSSVTSELSENDAVAVMKRSRAWYQVTTSNELMGWVKMLNVRFVGVLKREGELGVKNVFDSVITKQASPTASTGIRGFDEVELKKAKANLAQLAILSTYKSSPASVKQFAEQGNLTTNEQSILLSKNEYKPTDNQVNEVER